MKSLYSPEINKYRRMDRSVFEMYGNYGDSRGGVFMVPIKTHSLGTVKVIASSDEGWDHVSASFPDRCPTWDEMSMLKDLFFLPHELVVQFHPPKAMYVNHYPYTLHLWRSHTQDFKLPPTWMIGPLK